MSPLTWSVISCEMSHCLWVMGFFFWTHGPHTGKVQRLWLVHSWCGSCASMQEELPACRSLPAGEERGGGSTSQQGYSAGERFMYKHGIIDDWTRCFRINTVRFVKTRVGRRVSHSEAGSSALKLFRGQTWRPVFFPRGVKLFARRLVNGWVTNQLTVNSRRSTATKLMTAETRRERSNCLNRHKLLGGGN